MPNGTSPKDTGRQYKINAKRNGQDDYSFQLTDMSGGPADLVFNKTTNNMHVRDYYLLQFHLHNEPGCKLEFIDDRARVLSACAEPDTVNGCAPEGSEFLPVFFVHPTMPLGKKLVHVVNSDPAFEKFYFGFSFVSEDGTETAYFDPGGENQDGGFNKFEWNAALVGATSGAIAAAGTASFSNTLEPTSVLLYGVGGAVVGLIVGFASDRL